MKKLRRIPNEADFQKERFLYAAEFLNKETLLHSAEFQNNERLSTTADFLNKEAQNRQNYFLEVVESAL